MKAEKLSRRNKGIFPLFIALMITLLFTILLTVHLVIQTSSGNLGGQSSKENSNLGTFRVISQSSQDTNPGLDLGSEIFYTSHSTSSKSKSSTSDTESPEDDSDFDYSSSIDNEANPEDNFPEDSTPDSNNEETNSINDKIEDSGSTNNVADLDDTSPQTSDDKKSRLTDDGDFMDVIVLLKDDKINDEMLRITSDGPLEKRLSEIKSEAKIKEDEVLSTLNSSEFLLKYKYKTVSGFAGKITQEGLDKLKQNPNVEAIYEDKMLHITLMDSVPLINADDVWNLGVTGEGTVVCVVDTGIDYTHPDLGNCTQYEINGSVESYSLESPHPYDNYDNYTWTITKPGYSNIAVHFSNITIEGGWDYIYIRDVNNNIVQTFTGNYLNVWSVSVPGDTIKINFVTDFSIIGWGFAIDKILNGTATFRGLQDCEKVIDGYDFFNGDNDPRDDMGHGTHVAGIVAANGIVKGVAPDAELVAVKVCNSGGGCWGSDIIAGVDWCNNKKSEYNIVATTMSIGDSGQYNSTTCPKWMDDVINTAHNLGIAVTVASGNGGYINGISYPACSPNAISVGSTTKWDVISGSTNTGTLLDLLAPGSGIYSTIINGYGYMSGTSMATPHVAGAIALAKQYIPLALPDQIEYVLKKTGKLIVDPDNNLSFPRIDLLAAANYSECKNDSVELDCGIDGYIGNPFCQNDDVLQDYITYTCLSGVLCSNSTAPKLIKDCGEDYCENWQNNYCKDGDIYHKRVCYDKGCSSAECYNNPYTDEQKAQECEYGCINERCKIKICNYGKCYYV